MGKRIPFACTPENCGDNYSICGLASTYNNRACRCASCSEAKSQRDKERRKAMRRETPHAGGPCTPENCGSAYENCGKVVTYLDRGCRCDSCRDAKSESTRRRKQRIAADPSRWCKFEGCGRPLHGNGLCAGHLFQLKENRELSPLRPKRRNGGGAWTKNEMLEAAIPDGECLLFGVHQAIKYTMVVVSSSSPGLKAKCDLAHRHMYTLHTGEDISGRTIHHKCANAKCINPEHLQPASQAENTLEMLARRDYEAEIARLNDRVAELEAQLK